MFYFFTFAFLGWILEILVVFTADGYLINPGVLLGPWLPIYGVAMMILVFLARRISGDGKLFLVSFFVAGVIEYGTSWYLEKAHHARWWDYSDLMFNINGRVCIPVLLGFAGLAVVAARYVVPKLDKIYARIDGRWLTIVITLLTVLCVIDFFHSSAHPNVINDEMWQGRQDSNSRHRVLETRALPTELRPLMAWDFSSEEKPLLIVA